MADSWKVRALASKGAARAALVAHEDDMGWPFDWVLTGGEIAEDRPDDWFVEAFMPTQPTASDKRRIGRLFGKKPPRLTVEKIEEQDWVTLSQQGVEPIRAGRFHVRTSEFGADPAMVDFVIPASQAFGTGQHNTTAGCLVMLDLMKRQGVVVRNHADIGTGTGLLGFAAMHLWPRALATASDIDPVCSQVIADNAALNRIPLGGGPGELAFAIAAGMDSPLLQARTPFDLLIANILAGPLVELAPDFGAAVVPGGNLLLAGLLETQERTVRRAYRAQGFRLARRLVNGDWSILWLRKSRVR